MISVGWELPHELSGYKISGLGNGPSKQSKRSATKPPLTKDRFGFPVWKFCLGIYRLEMFAWELSLKSSLFVYLSRGDVRFEASVWDFLLMTFVLDLSLGDVRLETFA